MSAERECGDMWRVCGECVRRVLCSACVRRESVVTEKVCGECVRRECVVSGYGESVVSECGEVCGECVWRVRGEGARRECGE